MSVRKIYVDGPFGQIHVRTTSPVAGVTPLVCLHATAYSSQSFLPLMQAFNGRRQIIAIDTPGYGESDGPGGPVDIAAYADATVAAIEQLADGPVVILGYHSGGYIAAEIAIERPELVERLALIGVPYFQALDFDLWKGKLASPHHLDADLAQFAERWDYFVTNRHASVKLERGFANFVDELKAWPNGWWAHDALFQYDSDHRLPKVQQPVLILNPDSHLGEASRKAGALLSDCVIREMPDCSGPVLEAAPVQIANAIEDWLSEPATKPLSSAA